MPCQRVFQFGPVCSLLSISFCLSLSLSLGVKLFVKKQPTTSLFFINQILWTRAIERKKSQEYTRCGWLVPSVKITRISWHLSYICSPPPSGTAIVFSSLTNFILLTPVTPEKQSAEKQGKRVALAHLSGSPPGKKQRRDTDTFRGESSCLLYWGRTG